MKYDILFVWNIFAGILVALGALYFIRKYVNRFIVMRYISLSITFATHKRFEATKENIEILFLGTCEFRSGIDPRPLGPAAFNFSVPRISFIELYYYFKYYINRMRRLKLVILSTHPNSFCAGSATGMVAPLLFTKYINAGELASLTNPRDWPQLFSHKMFYGSGMAKIKGGADVLIRNLSQSINERQAAGQRDALKAAVEKAPAVSISSEDALAGVKTHYSYPMFDKRALYYFEKILRLCESVHVPVVTVCMPSSRYSQRHIRAQGYASDEDIAKTVIADQRFGKLIYKHLNYTDFLGGRDDLFQFDGWELNREGARVFSEKIAADITGIMKEIDSRTK